jgi:cytochrome c oxidase cbb3-type subunit 2
VARGKDLYAQKCLSCHGATGVGDGPSSSALRDARDARILPRDFTKGRLRGGESPQDLFRRLRTGLDGTPMPSYDDPDADLWAVVHYVMTLRRDTGAEEAIR